MGTEDTHNLEWLEEYSIGYERFDSEHREILKFANRVVVAIHGKQSQDIVARAFLDLQDQLEQHFLSEEARLAEAGYGYFIEHRAAHKAELEKLRTFIADSKNKSLEAAQVSAILKDLLLKHIQHDDSRYVSTLKARSGTLTDN